MHRNNDLLLRHICDLPQCLNIHLIRMLHLPFSFSILVFLYLSLLICAVMFIKVMKNSDLRMYVCLSVKKPLIEVQMLKTWKLSSAYLLVIKRSFKFHEKIAQKNLKKFFQ